MKKIWSITKTELAQLFYSPIAWMIIVIFGFQLFQSFTAIFSSLAEDLDMYGSLKDITYELFAGRRGLFPAICSNLYLYIPLLTMGLMSRDFSTGSIKLLHSSPVTSSQIILGKFLSMVLFSIIMLSLTVPTIIFADIKVENFDMGLTLTGLLGVFLLFWAYAAIGLFMSSLTSYQIVSALLTFGTFTLLNQLGTMGQQMEFLREITYWASISGRTEQFIAGLVSTEDLLYFALIISMFVSFCIYLLQYQKNNRKGQAVLKYAGTVVAVLLLGYLTSRPAVTFYHDSTQTQSNTITRNTQDVLAELDGKLKITTYVNLADYGCWIASPHFISNDVRSLKSYLRFKPDMKTSYVYFWDEPYCNYNYGDPEAAPAEETAGKFAESWHIRKVLTPEEIRQRVDLRAEKNSIVKLLETEDGQKTFLRTFDDMTKVPEEQEIATAMKRLRHPAVKVAFLEGHGERSIEFRGDEDWYDFVANIKERSALVNKGFDVFRVNLSEGDVLDGMDILVIADMRKPLTTEEEKQVTRFLDEGGNLLLAVEPAWVENSRNLLDYLGVMTFPGTLVHLDENVKPTLIPAKVMPDSKELSPNFVAMSTVTMPEAVSVEYRMNSDWDAWPLLFTESNCWNENEVVDFHKLEDNSQLVRNVAAHEFQKKHTTALGLQRKNGGKNQNVVVLGDADCLSNLEMTIKRKELKSFNKYFFGAVFNWLSDGEMPVNVRRPAPMDNDLDLTPEEAGRWTLFFKWLIPALLALMGIVIVVRRTRR